MYMFCKNYAIFYYIESVRAFSNFYEFNIMTCFDLKYAFCQNAKSGIFH